MTLNNSQGFISHETLVLMFSSCWHFFYLLMRNDNTTSI